MWEKYQPDRPDFFINTEWTSLLPLIIPIAVCAGRVHIGSGLRRFKNWARVIATALLTTVLAFAVVVWIYGYGKVGNVDEFVMGYAWLIWLIIIPAIPVYYLNHCAAPRKVFNRPTEGDRH